MITYTFPDIVQEKEPLGTEAQATFSYFNGEICLHSTYMRCCEADTLRMHRRGARSTQAHILGSQAVPNYMFLSSSRAYTAYIPSHCQPANPIQCLDLTGSPIRVQVSGPSPALMRMLGLRILPAAFSAVQK